MSNNPKRKTREAFGGSRTVCSQCGFRIRGKNHEDGDHHNAGRDGKYKPVKH